MPGKCSERLISWAGEVEELPNVHLVTPEYTGGEFSLRLMSEKRFLANIWNKGDQPSIAVHRSAFERHAPNSIDQVERTIAPKKLGHGNEIKEQDITDNFLDALKAAYEEATRS